MLLQFLAYAVLLRSTLAIGVPEATKYPITEFFAEMLRTAEHTDVPGCAELPTQLPNKFSDGDYIWGRKLPFDKLLTTIKVEEPKKEPERVYKPVTYEVIEEDTTITFIEVKKANPQNRGYADVTGGGVGHRNVTICLSSSKKRGLEYVVNIYGQ